MELLSEWKGVRLDTTTGTRSGFSAEGLAELLDKRLDEHKSNGSRFLLSEPDVRMLTDWVEEQQLEEEASKVHISALSMKNNLPTMEELVNG